MPTLNRPSISYSVESIQNQTVKDWKLIICGDGVQPPKFNDDRIQTIHIPKRNQSKARQATLPLVQTDWVAFVDDDDWITPDYLEKFLKFTHNSDVIISQMLYQGNVIPQEHKIIYATVGICFAVKTEIWKKNPMPDPHGEDFKFLKSLEEQNYKISFTDYCGYFVRKNLITMI